MPERDTISTLRKPAAFFFFEHVRALQQSVTGVGETTTIKKFDQQRWVQQDQRRSAALNLVAVVGFE